MLSRIQLKKFRGFRQFSVSFGKATYLVGPNNAGKSTILTALRLIDSQLRVGYARRPALNTDVDGVSRVAYPMSLDGFQTLNESIRYDFGTDEARVQVEWTGGAGLQAIWPELDGSSRDEDNGPPHFFLTYANGGQPRSGADVRRHFPSLGVIPPLGPVDASEPVLTAKYVRSNMGGRLSSRHFRNYMMLLDQAGRLQSFFDFANEWTPELQLVDFRVSGGINPGLDVFYVEGKRRHEREIAWAGDGTQVWWQILHHMYQSKDLPTLVLDEPEVFLHPDLQRRLMRLLDESGKQVIVATHSSEMLSEIDSKSIVLVDRTTSSARKLKDDSGLLAISDQIGSRFNLALAKALRARVVLFVEGDDARLLKITAGTTGYQAVERESEIAIVPMGGFSPHVHVEAFQWLCRDYLARSVRPFVLLDRDYRPDTQLDGVRSRFDRVGIAVHIWEKKEIENYYLSPALLARVTGVPEDLIERYLDEAANEHRATTSSQIASCRMEAEVGPKNDRAGILEDAMSRFDSQWLDRAFRLSRTPAKAILASVNRRLQADSHKALSFTGIARQQRPDEVDPEMLTVLEELSRLL